jgi:hypothetical protein
MKGSMLRHGRDGRRSIKDSTRTSELEELAREKGSDGGRRRPDLGAKVALLELAQVPFVGLHVYLLSEAR